MVEKRNSVSKPPCLGGFTDEPVAQIVQYGEHSQTSRERLRRELLGDEVASRRVERDDIKEPQRG